MLLLVALAYGLNRFWLKQAVDLPVITYILNCYCNDWLAGIAIVAYGNLVLHRSKYRSWRIITIAGAGTVCAVCGLLWEYILPLVFPHGTSDIWDIAAYILGGWTYIWIQKRQKQDSA